MHGVIADTDRVQMPVTATTTVSDVIEYITAKYPGITIDKESIVTAVEGHDRFQKLAQRYAALTEQITWAQQGADIKKKFQRFWRPISRKPPCA